MAHFLIETRPRTLLILGLVCLTLGGGVMVALALGLVTVAQVRPFRMVTGTALGLGIVSLAFGGVRALIGRQRPREDG